MGISLNLLPKTWLQTTQDIVIAQFLWQTFFLWPPPPTFYSRLRTKFLPNLLAPLLQEDYLLSLGEAEGISDLFDAMIWKSCHWWKILCVVNCVSCELSL
jgi:hypothetical protein